MKIAIITFLVFCSISTSGQDIDYSSNLYGEWKVIKWLPLIPYSRTMEDIEEYKQDKNNCLGARIVISNSGIAPISRIECEINECTGLSLLEINDLKVYPDNDSTLLYPGLEIDRGVVGKKLAKEIGIKGKSSIIASTSCKIEWGDEGKLRVILISKRKIAFFRGGDILVFTRK